MAEHIGLLGYGYWGPHLLRNFSQLGCEVVVGDPNPASRERLAENRPDVTAYSSADEVLASGVDAVVICTPARTHFTLAKQDGRWRIVNLVFYAVPPK